jgi:hypothetical protein
VYHAADMASGLYTLVQCALKATTDAAGFLREVDVYTKLQGGLGIPSLIWSGRVEEGYVLMVELLVRACGEPT